MSAVKESKADATFAAMTRTFIDALKEGEINPDDWTPPWRRGHAGLPHNVSTGNAYQGGNVLLCWAAAMRNEFDFHGWATYKQWNDMDWQVQKHEKSTTLVKWIINFRCTAEGCGNRGSKPCRTHEGASKKSIFPKAFTVFNADQVREVLEWETYVDRNGNERRRAVRLGDSPYRPEVDDDVTAPDPVAVADEFFQRVGADVHNAPGRAFYSPSGDYISVPPLVDFFTAEGYYATLGHEHIHWTGAKSRLGRELSMEREKYAFEELVAELGAAFLGAHLGTTPEVGMRDDHKQYLASWLRALGDDTKLLWRAAGLAQKALDHLVGLAADGTVEAEVEDFGPIWEDALVS